MYLPLRKPVGQIFKTVEGVSSPGNGNFSYVFGNNVFLKKMFPESIPEFVGIISFISMVSSHKKYFISNLWMYPYNENLKKKINYKWIFLI